MIKYKIFVIFHNEINISYYDESVLNHIIFINVNPNNVNIYKDLTVINLYQIQGFIPLGKWYAESEVIYNVYKNKTLIENLDYIGFTHYDIHFNTITDSFLQNNFQRFALINLQSYTFKEDFDQKILMDKKHPNQRAGSGLNCYSTIFDDFNNYYKTSYSTGAFFQNKFICLCSSFIIRKETFNEMMSFASKIIESKKLDLYDTEHRYRIQGGFLERYYATWFLLKGIESLNLKLKHDFVESNNQLSLFSIFKKNVFAFIKECLYAVVGNKTKLVNK